MRIRAAGAVVGGINKPKNAHGKQKEASFGKREALRLRPAGARRTGGRTDATPVGFS
jgi:hypothetical protein